MKICKTCLRSKPLSAFARGHSCKDGRRGSCYACQYLKTSARTNPNCHHRLSVDERIESYIQRGRPDQCWVWLGPQLKSGYGTLVIGNRSRRAHRAVYERSIGPIPANLCVIHTCDNKLCVNPNHLRLGTHQDNMRDMFAKGRCRRPRGEQHHNAKLTVQKVREIRSRYRRGLGPRLSREYNLSLSTILGVARGGRWAWVN